MSDTPDNNFTDDEIKALETEYEDVLVLHDGLDAEERRYTYVLRPAEPLQWRQFESKASNEDTAAQAMAPFIQSTVVAVAFKGEKAIGKDAARKLWERLIKRYAAAASGKDLVQAVMKFNGAAKATRSK